MPANQSEPVKSLTDIPEDEIALIDLLRVIWKWKYLITIGTAVCVLAAVIFNFNKQPIYQVRMVLKSGINKVGFDGKPAYLDSVENFKTLIDGELLFKLLNHSKNKGKVVSSRAFKILANNKTNTLRILYESTNREEGIESLTFLSNMLIERYKKRLSHLQDEYKYELLIAKRQLEFSINEQDFITSKLIDIQKRLENYTEEIGPLNGSSESKAKYQTNLLDYASIVEIIADLKRRHSHVNSQIAFYKKEIAGLEKEKISKQAIIVARPSSASPHPIKPKIIRNVMLATGLGLFVMLLLSIFLEYISKNKMQNAQNDRAKY